MVTISVTVDDELNAALEALSAGQGRPKGDLVTDLIRRYVEQEQLKRALQDPELIRLYGELAAEDVALAEQGMGEYQRLLGEADQS